MIVDMEDELSANETCAKPLQRRYVFYYGVGHMLNDITSACWFTYLLLFLTEIGLTPRYVFHKHANVMVLVYFCSPSCASFGQACFSSSINI